MVSGASRSAVKRAILRSLDQTLPGTAVEEGAVPLLHAAFLLYLEQVVLEAHQRGADQKSTRINREHVRQAIEHVSYEVKKF